MKKLFYICIITLYCNITYGQNIPNFKSSNIEINKAKQWVDSTYNSLTLDDKIAQLFIIAAYVNKDNKHKEEVNELVNKEHIGGLILMQDDPFKQVKWVNSLQKQVKVPLLIGIDGEWGLAQRFNNTIKFPWAMTLGAITNDSLIYETAKRIAIHCKRMGIHWDFAPVVDINVNPNNPIIGNRSFGSDKYNVVKKAIAYMKGLHSEGILASAKHFPGHGDTNTDSHLELPIINHDKKRLDSLELYPFKELIKNGVDGIMVSHLYIPIFEKNKIPATLSYNIITKLLKEEMGYKGLIVTDALNMQGIAKYFPYGEMDYLAFKAGNDVLLFSQGVITGKKKIKDAIEKGEISMSRLEESVKKILYAKYYVNLDKPFTDIPENNLMKDLHDEESENLKKKLFASAITKIKTDQSYFPLNENKKYLYLPLENGNYDTFYSELQKRFKHIQKITPNDLKTKKYSPKEYQLIIGIHKDTESTIYYLPKLSEETKKTIIHLSKKYAVTLCDFISPYSLNKLDISHVKNLFITYQNNDYTQKSIISILDGSRKAKGKLPITIAK